MRWFRSRQKDPLTSSSAEGLEETFSTIYRERTWTDALPGMPRSGRGALFERSLPVVEFIEAADIQSIVDIGCGDLTYMSQIPAITSGAISYIGYEIVPELVAEHRELPWGEFRVGDITASDFRVSADLVLVKDVLFHLDDAQIARALDNLKSSEWRYLLLTSSGNDTNEGRAFDRWHFAPVNFLLPPYEFTTAHPLERVDGGAFLVLRPEDLTWPK